MTQILEERFKVDYITDLQVLQTYQRKIYGTNISIEISAKPDCIFVFVSPYTDSGEYQSIAELFHFKYYGELRNVYDENTKALNRLVEYLKKYGFEE